MSSTRTLSVRELRQNPTDAIDEVADGHVLTVTRNGRPVADLVPHVNRKGVAPEEVLRALRETPVDAEWADELVQARRANDAVDPWAES